MVLPCRAYSTLAASPMSSLATAPSSRLSTGLSSSSFASSTLSAASVTAS